MNRLTEPCRALNSAFEITTQGIGIYSFQKIVLHIKKHARNLMEDGKIILRRN